MADIFEWEGKQYLRMGECVRCGMCCTGYPRPCEHLKWETPEKSVCLIWGEEHGLGKSQCAYFHNFPDGPQSQWHPSIKNKCGYYFVEVDRILIGAPTYDGKKYCEKEYYDAIRALDWPIIDLHMIDTTNWSMGGNRRIALGMEKLRQKFLKGNYDRWFNLEADVIIPPETIRVMLAHGRKADWISHYYPARGKGPEEPMSGFGCSIFSRKIIEDNSFEDTPDNATTDGWWWNTKIKPKVREYTCVELWGLLEIRHLDG